MLHQLRWPAAIQVGHQFCEALHHLAELAIGRLIDWIYARTGNMVAVEGQMISVRLQRYRGLSVAELEACTVKVKIFDDAAIKL